MNVLEGKLTGEGLKIALVASRFNEFIMLSAWNSFPRHLHPVPIPFKYLP